MLIAFFFSCVTVFALAPALVSLRDHRRHFELFIAVSHLVSLFCFSFLDGVNKGADSANRMELFLNEVEWHETCNVLTYCYFGLLAVHLAQVSSTDVAHFVRYSVIALIYLAQRKDNFWVTDRTGAYTITVSVLVVTGSLAHLVAVHGRGPLRRTDDSGNTLILGVYHPDLLAKGGGFLLAALAVFVVSLQSDSYRILHGLAHVLAGIALMLLWKLGKPTGGPEKDSYGIMMAGTSFH